jgi:hypothetical protein
MKKLLAGAAAIGVAALISMGSASAASQQHRPDGMRNSDQIEVSSARRHYRRYYYHGPRYGYYGPRYYRPYYGYNAYGYSPYYRPYYRPGPYVGVGPGGIGFGFGF